MKWLNGDRMKMVVVGVVAAIVVSGGNAKADFTFGEPTNMGPLINGAGNDNSSSLTPDGLQMYFGSDREGGVGEVDLWMSTRPTKDDEWAEPVNLGESFNSLGWDLGPSLSSDGLEFYFCREDDLWVAKRASIDDPWGEPTNLGPTVNSEEFDCGPCISPDSLTLYFYSFLTDDGAIWMTMRPTVSDAWGPPVKLDSPIDTETLDYWPHITSDGLALLFSSDRGGGFGSADIWIVTRPSVSHPWGPPINLGPPVNTKAYDACPYVSSDGLTYYFTSDRDGGHGSYDLWQAPIIPIVDFDGDSLIGMGDLMMLIANWGQDEPICDVGPMPWGDGTVDEADLEVLMSQWGQEVNYLHDPRQASRPTPLDDSISDVEQAALTRWIPGRHAAQHDVYVGADPVAVENADLSDTMGIYRGRQEASEYTLPETVLPNQTFYWRIDEFNRDDTLTKGPVWSFSVADYLIIDDFESSEAAWARWWDGWGDPNNGSEVATEFTTVHNGNQGMWLFYDNGTAPISQALRIWETPQDWTRKGVETLILWFHGGPDNTAEPLQISLGDSADNVAVVVHPDPAVLSSGDWQQWPISLADVAGVNLAEITSMTFVIGDDTTQEGGIGEMYIDDICLRPVSMQEMPGKVGGNIIWVSDQSDYENDQDDAPDDYEWVDILEAEGYAVDYTMGAAPGDGYWRTLDAEKTAALNAADLIIISRNNTNSKFGNGDEEDQWNSVTTPIINTTAGIAMKNQWNWRWLETDYIPNSGEATVDILVPDHPIFESVTSPVQITDGNMGLTTLADVTGVGVGNGTMLAQLAVPTANEVAAIVVWEPGAEFYQGSGQVAGGPRMLFCAGTYASYGYPSGSGAMNLTPDGLNIFLSAVKMYVGR